MLGKTGVLDMIDLKVDYLMSASSYAEHGANLITVNHYELCAQSGFDAPSTEWWPFVACMYSIQDCLNYNTTEQAGTMTCAEAESGSDDDMEISGIDGDVSSCTCTLSGVAEYCATEYLSTSFEDLTECADGDTGKSLAMHSKARAEAANSGYPLWIMVNNITIFDNWSNEHAMIDTWASSVFSAVCDHEELGTGSTPAACE